MQIGEIKRINLGIFPTPLQELSALSAYLGGPRIFLKRDDLDGIGLGGNKLRKLEYAMAEAMKEKATAVITTGAVQSNHCRLVAAAANKLGLQTYLILVGDEPAIATGNLLVDKLLGAVEIRYIHKQNVYERQAQGEDPMEQAVQELQEELASRGEVPYYIPNGCRPLHGALGYANCVREIVGQLHTLNLAPDYIVTACGSSSTQGGLILGSRLYSAGEAEIIGISISRDKEQLREKITASLAKAYAFLGLDRPVPAEKMVVYDEYVGEGYAIPTLEMKEAVKLTARKEGIVLDPVYTGKAMAGLIDLIQQGRFRKDEVVVMIHTGGIPGLFAEGQVANLQDL